MPIVAEYMTRFLHSVGPDHSVAAAHRLMQRHKIRHLPIFDDRQLVGTVSQRVLYFLETVGQTNIDTLKVREVMETDVLSIEPSASIAEAARLMVDRKATAVFVLNEGRVAGIFTTIDALKVLAGMGEAGSEKDAADHG